MSKPSEKDPFADLPKNVYVPPPPPEPIPLLEGYPDIGQGDQVVTLTGTGEDSQVRIGCPIPQSLSVAGTPFDLSDRAAGIYTFRHK